MIEHAPSLPLYWDLEADVVAAGFWAADPGSAKRLTRA
jgi:hypothetical protein